MFVTVRHYSDNFRRDINGSSDTELLDIARDCFNNNNYIKVADLEIESNNFNNILETTFNLTNSIETAWYKSTDERFIDICLEDKGLRSTRVGDLIQINGKNFVVTSYGFDEII